MTGESLGTLEGHTWSISCLAFSPDGLRLASGGADSTVRLWYIAITSTLGPPFKLNSPCSHLYFSEDGRSLHLDNETILNVSQDQLQPLSSPCPTVKPSLKYSIVTPASQGLWSVCCPDRRYRIPDEFGMQISTKWLDKTALAMEHGQVMVIDFGKFSDPHAHA
ncbi:hypothetical protein PIIN_10254 [Serendipita indica DSM 11827]|uniref:Uncharacterized protein n=1 Tax=Serendipita indica (strain DSM 11827) TaxID=1109443 RepID=G4TY66_SERID|nr:hypothetical protein PIIN_10254 [Serendipita indica DSM 11827]